MNEEGKSTENDKKEPPVTPASPPSAQTSISISEFQKVALRTGRIISAEEHPNADRLLILKVDIGEEQPRQLVAGIKSSYQPADLTGKQVLVASNIAPALIRGIQGQGMVLAAQDSSGLSLLTLDRPVSPGSIVK